MNRTHAFALGFVTVSVPVSGWRGGTHAVRKQRVRLRCTQNDLEDGTLRLAIAAQSARADLQDAHKQVVIARQSIEQSTENLRLAQERYRAGTVTMSDLLEAQALHRQSRDKYAEAYAQLRVKTAEYLQATGR